MTDDTCPVCGCDDTVAVFRRDRVPMLCNRLWPTRAAAQRARTATIDLVFCTDCQHLFNRCFEAGSVVYTSEYENSLHISPTFQTYAADLASELVDLYALEGKSAVDVGCGRGEFLRLLCERGLAEATGYDPAGESAKIGIGNSSLTLVGEPPPRRFPDRPNLLCCRHALEHVHDPKNFLSALRLALGDGAPVALYFEVPNGEHTIGQVRLWDVLYEHYSYFTRRSLRRLFSRCELSADRIESVFETQFLRLDGSTRRSPSESIEADAHDLSEAAASFAQKAQEQIAIWRRRIDHWHRGGSRMVLWGAGSKGIMFLNFLALAAEVDAVVDINPRKVGRYVPVTGHPVVAPAFLPVRPPDIVLLTNPAYQVEIRAHLADLGLRPEIHII